MPTIVCDSIQSGARFPGTRHRPFPYRDVSNWGKTPGKWRSILATSVPLMVAIAILMPVAASFADDSVTRLGAGGITFIKSEHIRMLEEVLDISTKLIRVNFRFLNESDKDIHTTVAFPLPLYDERSASIDGPPSVPHPLPIMATFKVWVHGRPVTTNVERKAMVHGRDVTARLRQVGLSDKQLFDTFDLTLEQQAAVKKLDGGIGALLDWKVAETAFWQQNFPAGKEIVVEHEYEPIVGSSYTMPYQKGFGYASDIVPSRGDTNEACLDASTRRGIEKKIKARVARGETGFYVYESDVEYILKTGRNWKGPIRDFTLRIEKESPDQLVSLCFPGKPKKVSPTLYEFHCKDFIPPDKVVVYFYTVGHELK